MEEILRLDSLVIYRAVLGMVQTNTYLAVDTEAGEAVVVDPAAKGHWIMEKVRQSGWRLTSVWLTHAHFDHFEGAAAIEEELGPSVSLMLHPDDLPLFRQHGGAQMFGLSEFELPAEPDHLLQDGEKLYAGGEEFTTLSTPGHSPGHVVYLSSDRGVMFCGDLIFKEGVGRTDLPGGNRSSLEQSIRTRVFPLPPETVLLPGHGERTTVGAERRDNPYVQGVV